MKQSKNTLPMKPGNAFIVGLFFLGLVVIVAAEAAYTAPAVAAAHADREMLGDRIAVSGTIQRIHQADEAAFIHLAENPELSIVKFTNRNLSVREGEEITVQGTVDLYRGKLEIIADTIK